MIRLFSNALCCSAIFVLLSALPAYAAGFLSFPLAGDPYSVPITAIMDHNTNRNTIVTYTGEKGTYADGCLAYVGGRNVACTSLNTSAPRAFKRPNNTSWSITINYDDGYSRYGDAYMWYDNHRGYDYPADEWTPIYAAAAGTVTSYDAKWGQLTINHGNSYRTIYTHMKLNAPLSTKVRRGQHIGWVSNIAPTPVPFHLHFVVQKQSSAGAAWQNVDPYGYKGSNILWE